jgi:O-antigen ligase
VIGTLAVLAALLYCFPWLRPPEIGGVALPLQRVLAWVGLAVLLSCMLLKGSLRAGPAARGFLRMVALFLLFLVLLLVRQLVYGENFFLLYFLMDLSKYAAAFATAYLCYHALSARLVSDQRLVRSVVLSGTAATFLVFGFLALYFAGFRTEWELIAPSFGGALGVWPTDALLPRLAGTTAEPQQLSVALLTPMLLMLSPQYLRRFWPVALLSGCALLLSQSKFALVSVMVAGLYVMLVYRRARLPIGLAALILGPAIALVFVQLPTIAGTLQSGLSARALIERLENLVLMVSIIREHPFLGIGAGHYGVYRGQVIYGDWSYDPGYAPNMDFLKVFAETGLFGFVLILLLLGSLVRRFIRSYRRVPAETRPVYLALLLGGLTIVLNMTIGYELLHAFFWINVGVLLFYVDRAYSGQEPNPPSDANLLEPATSPSAHP